MSGHLHAPRRLPRLRFAARHPVRTLRRNQRKAIRGTGFGLGQLVGIGVFAICVVGWLAYQYLSQRP
ncbi:hypothetical protein SLUN_00395 [Streptomyces lunaelactis]|uniref:Uncharacterized protein n=1 Tax=Streptomyces lunaelactis TaxID=1535768 RepID=A0A2R4SVS4_9ACTN|nr:hypothetical protein [Streptomyces lunaelactis]AVZ70954.1 hypothetical protein SLUN_00395 [Streptomyces lunaelactis]NUK28059.1 hypothetical protein [Streptomyces lunaelactis]NUK89728.1 hypothetical protein [Streptomyces lunaelactis]